MDKKDKKYSRRVLMYKAGYIAVHVYLNVDTRGNRYYDTVIYRKIKKNGGFEHARGTNFKPEDIPILIKLLGDVDLFLKAEGVLDG